MVTETDRIARALDDADTLWPEAGGDRSALLRLVVNAGIEVVNAEVDRQREQRHESIAALSGAFTGVWPERWRDEMRDEWPA